MCPRKPWLACRTKTSKNGVPCAVRCSLAGCGQGRKPRSDLSTAPGMPHGGPSEGRVWGRPSPNRLVVPRSLKLRLALTT